MEIPDQLQIRIPKALASKDIRAAVGLGLFKTAIGREPGIVPDGPRVNQRINLSTKAKQYFADALEHSDDQQEIIINALTWVYHQPAHVRQTFI